MRRLLRYGLIWLICTTCTVTVGFLAVGFVMDEAGGTPPTVQADSATDAGPSVSASPSAVTSVMASPPASAASSSPGRSHGASAGGYRASATPSAHAGSTGSCQGGVGAHTVHSQGGQASVMFGSSAVCLISAVPAPGFTAQTQQPAPGTLVITFCGSTHRSQITAHLSPYPGSETRETSWQIPSSSMC